MATELMATKLNWSRKLLQLSQHLYLQVCQVVLVEVELPPF